ncbi:ABC transporter substrate-binding protein [Neiella marina]|nr:ABC transporter substrate-binding protein [Neiella marina]
MKAAARDLNIELKVVYTDANRFTYTAAVMEEINADIPPDFLVYIFLRGQGAALLSAAEQKGLRSFLINSSVPVEEREEIGLPREKYPHWLGHMYADDVKVGYDLAEHLFQLARRNGIANPEMIAVGGVKDSSATLDRDEGLLTYLQQQPALNLNQLVHASWTGATTPRKAGGLLKRYANTHIIWAANDSIAIQASITANELRGTRENIWVGGVDWSAAGIAAVKDGLIDVTYGGHFLEGASVMVLLHDFYHGHDFGDQSLVFKTTLQAITLDNYHQFEALLSDQTWSGVDFAQFSKIGKDLDDDQDYSFDWQTILSQRSTPATTD